MYIAVNLKSQLSIVLPIGRYVAEVHHIQLYGSFGKYTHRLRERDVDNKDKQNFDMVLNVLRCAPLLKNLPGALTTKHYVELIQCIQ